MYAAIFPFTPFNATPPQSLTQHVIQRGTIGEPTNKHTQPEIHEGPSKVLCLFSFQPSPPTSLHSADASCVLLE